ADARRQGFGLVGMTERVRLVGGAIAIDSRPGGGCRVSVRLPITNGEGLPKLAAIAPSPASSS
ncbi:MAG: sensor histidine kinase, partial [Gemmatimonadota bacterium]